MRRFDTPAPTSAIYVASGGVEGVAVNQFALDEEDGFLRIARTVDRTIVDNGDPRRVEARNRVRALAEADGTLSVVDQTADVATGISFVGALDRVDLYREVDDRGFTTGWSPWIRRSVMADAFSYAISDAGIRVAGTADLDDPLATVVFRDAIPK